MKTFGEPLAKLVMPSGRDLPRAPVPGELFHLDVDMPQVDPLLPWYPKGSYVFSGYQWMMMNDSGKRRGAAPIGATTIEVENVCWPKDMPTRHTGFPVTDVSVTPTSRKATMSGQATLWAQHPKGANIWLVVFRKDKIVSLVVQHLPAGMPQTLSLTFYDIPNSNEGLVYSLRVYCDTVGMLGINQCTKFTFDGVPETAFIVEQNS